MSGEDIVRRLIWALDHDHRRVESAVGAFIPLLEDEVRRLVRLQMSREGSEISFQPTALVNEAGLRFGELQPGEYGEHFRAIAAVVVRRVLVDVARTRVSLEQADDAPQVTSDEARVSIAWSADLLALDEALNALAARDERRGRVAELKVFGGLAIADITNTIYVAQATVKHEWLAARAELARELERMDRWSVGPPRT